MQKIMFDNGAFVLHKVKIGKSSAKFSAWYTLNGELKDCERIDARGRSYQPGSRQLSHLAWLGKIWAL